MTKLQRIVLEKSKEQLEKEPWFRGINISQLPCDESIVRDGMDYCVSQLIFDTGYWDDPNFFVGM